MMDVIEFRTTIKDGMIVIPPEYQGKIENQVRVILVSETSISRGHDLIDKLLNQPIQITEFRPMSREELYAR